MSKKDPAIRMISNNKRARYDYEILDTLEAGLSLVGSEVKSLRNGKASLAEAYVRFENGEAWLVNGHIPEYNPASHQNHDPRRRRKLLMSAQEINRWIRKVQEQGLTCVPLKLYFRGAWVKLEIALGRGKKQHDKRAAIREREDRRAMDRALRKG